MVSPVFTPGCAAVCQCPQGCARSWARLAQDNRDSTRGGGTVGGPRCYQRARGTIRDQNPGGPTCASGRLGGESVRVQRCVPATLLGFKLHGCGEGDGDNRRAWPHAGG